MLRALRSSGSCGNVVPPTKEDATCDEWCGYEGWEEHEARAWAEFCAEFRVSFEWIAPAVKAPPTNQAAQSDRTRSSTRAMHCASKALESS